MLIVRNAEQAKAFVWYRYCIDVLFHRQFRPKRNYLVFHALPDMQQCIGECFCCGRTCLDTAINIPWQALKLSIPVLLALACLSLVHLVGAKLRFLNVTPRSRLLSIAGGISVAYVFVRLLPELGHHQEVLRQAAGERFAFLEYHAYLVALFGLTTFYGLDRAALQSRRLQRQTTGADVTSPQVFWVSTSAFAIYNALVGYLLLHEEQSSLRRLLFFTLAMTLHFIVNDFGLREHHKNLYTRIGRWILASAIIAGSALAFAVEIGPVALALLVAFLSGGVILNVLKEELPEERESRFSAFALGAFGYAALLLSL